MKPRITLITLGVDNLEKSLAFYRDGLGLPTEGIIGKEFEHGAVAFFDLQPGLKLAIWPRDSIAHDLRIPKTPRSPTECMLAHNVSAAENDKLRAGPNVGAERVKDRQPGILRVGRAESAGRRAGDGDRFAAEHSLDVGARARQPIDGILGDAGNAVVVFRRDEQ